MIIKISVRDNDYGTIMDKLMFSLKNGYPEIGNIDEANALDYFKGSRRWNAIYHEDSLSDEEKKFIVNRITAKFHDIIKDEDEKTKEYLMGKFICEFVESFTGTWENGESYYFIPKSYSSKFINM